MKNKAPIFINSFARGGSSILLNIIRSHPDVCYPQGETHQIFRGRKGESFFLRLYKRFRYLPILVAFKRDIFLPNGQDFHF